MHSITCSETGVDDTPVWKDHDSASCHFVVDGSRRCLGFLDHFCVFTVVNKKTGSKMLAKGVNALVYADYVASSRKMQFTSHCVDNEVTETEVSKTFLHSHCADNEVAEKEVNKTYLHS